MTSIFRLLGGRATRAVTAGLILAFSVGVGLAASDEALLSGSERLLFATLGRDRPDGGADLYRQIGFGFGLGYQDHAEPLMTALWLSPVLYWDPNVNNGLSRDRLVISEMEFLLPSEMVARDGIVYGFEAGATQRWAVAPGLTLQPEIGLSLTNADAWDEPAKAARASLCAVRTIEAGRWTTLCLQQSHYSGGASQTINQTDLLIGQDVFLGGTAGGTAHLLGVTAWRSFLPEGHRDSVGLHLVSAWPGFGSTDLNVEVGSRLPEVESRTRYVGASVTKILFGRPTEFTAYADKREGGHFLGEIVVEHGVGIGFARPVNDRLKIEVMAEKSRSNADAYNSSGISVRFMMPSLSFYR